MPADKSEITIVISVLIWVLICFVTVQLYRNYFGATKKLQGKCEELNGVFVNGKCYKKNFLVEIDLND